QIRTGGPADTEPYIFANLTGRVIRVIVKLDRKSARDAPDTKGLSMRGAIFRVWEDAETSALITKSRATVKADAAQISYAAEGTEITWAVLDSGIDEHHVHFALHANLEPNKPCGHKDFTGTDPGRPLVDQFGHGTHVAGIIAGQFIADDQHPVRQAGSKARDESGAVLSTKTPIPRITGMAPQCKLISMKVLGDDGKGRVSMIIDALQEIQRLNDHGRRIMIHGVNLSVGYDFDPLWFACGQSPLCVEVDRLVRSGVVVVVAAGNTGYGWLDSDQRGSVGAGMALSINDPGNADLAITVGSTHRDMPYTYGVSYFSSKGPTGDGRMKPDLVAPGERIISCAAGGKRDFDGEQVDYVEDSGTSMAAPHVSGVIAAFLSIRREFIGRPADVKTIFMSTASDLKRERSFQGSGLVDVMRAIQSI
ncbi:MAG: serine protease AprX, partial [Candidatus Eremiobacteraeota bacterium]|nr:serine protease AprX [Candidatus Eremiobacteraeota bacterium]